MVVTFTGSSSVHSVLFSPRSSGKDLAECTVTRTKPTASGHTSYEPRPHRTLRVGAQRFFFFEGGHRGLPTTLQLQLSCFDHFSPPKCHRPLIIRPVQPQRSHGPAPLPSALEPSARPQAPIHTRRFGGRRVKGTSLWK